MAKIEILESVCEKHQESSIALKVMRILTPVVPTNVYDILSTS